MSAESPGSPSSSASSAGNPDWPLQLDLERRARCGYPEAIYAEGKSIEVLVQAFRELHERGEHCLATRVSAEQAEAVLDVFPQTSYRASARTLRLMQPVRPQEAPAPQRSAGEILIVTAGTTDAGVAEEAAETLRWMEFEPRMIHDVGVAGPQRLLRRVPELQQARVIIVVAGMEGTLPSAVAGWVACPVIAVPTSVGYGANLGGVAALLGMLNSCAANVCVVNIDAGFKAGFLAGLMLTSLARPDSPPAGPLE